MSWQEALAFASRPNGIMAIVGFVSAWLAENWSWYQKQAAKQKRIYYGIVCLAVPVIAATLLALSGYSKFVWEGLYWEAVQAGFLAYVAGSGVHGALYLGKKK